MADKEIVNPDTIMAAVAGSRAAKGTYVQRAGLWLAAGVGLVIAGVIVGIFIQLAVTHPSLSDLVRENGGSKSGTLTIEAYRELSTLSMQNAKELFQVVVTQALLPVLTAILGYIFGRGENQREH